MNDIATATQHRADPGDVRTMIVCAIKDRALDAFMRPFFMMTRAQAIRGFQDEVNRAAPDNPLHAHPEDHDLYMLAAWSETSGKFYEHIERLAMGKDSVLQRN